MINGIMTIKIGNIISTYKKAAAKIHKYTDDVDNKSFKTVKYFKKKSTRQSCKNIREQKPCFTIIRSTICCNILY